MTDRHDPAEAPAPDSPELHAAPLMAQLHAFVDQHRDMLLHCADGLTEEEARTSLVPSSTTILGLITHATFVEQVWFGEAVTARSRADLGIVAGPEESFHLRDEETIRSATRRYAEAVEASRRAVRDMCPDTVLPGNRRGPLPLRWVLLHVLRELAQHCGHADILREQLLARRGSRP